MELRKRNAERNVARTGADSRIDQESLAALAAGAERADRSTDWPAALASIARSPRTGFAIPKEFGGEELDPVALLEFDEAVAASCATVALILSQRAAAIRLLLRSSSAIKERWLPPLASGEAFATVGLAQITTSRQHGASALLATARDGGGFRLDGAIPWVTGADRANVLVVGATLEDGRQIVTTLPTDRRGIAIGSPLALSALAGSRTASVKCEGVEIAADEIILGPTGKVLGGAGGGGPETSCLALGLARAATEDLSSEAAERPQLGEMAEKFAAALIQERKRLHEFVAARNPPEASARFDLRVRCTRLALKATQAGLLAAKGTGFLADRPAQRRARQALFLLVWSCPGPVSEGIAADLLAGI